MATHNHQHQIVTGQRVSARLASALTITAAFVVVEVVAGLASNSLALLSDAAHNVTDVIALALSWYALRLDHRPANSRKTFGYHRAGILVALANAVGLIAVAVGLFYEAYQRFFDPPAVQAVLLIEVAALALLVNGGTAWLVHRGSAHDLNLRSAFLHLLGDVLSTAGALAAGVAIYYTGMSWLDPLASALIGLLILWNAWGILEETLEILLESTPRDIDMSQMVRDLMCIRGVQGVHDLHVWSISRSLRALSAHILTGDITLSEGTEIRRHINGILLERYSIVHTTLQIECGGCEPDLLYCSLQHTASTTPPHNHYHGG